MGKKELIAASWLGFEWQPVAGLYLGRSPSYEYAIFNEGDGRVEEHMWVFSVAPRRSGWKWVRAYDGTLEKVLAGGELLIQSQEDPAWVLAAMQGAGALGNPAEALPDTWVPWEEEWWGWEMQAPSATYSLYRNKTLQGGRWIVADGLGPPVRLHTLLEAVRYVERKLEQTEDPTWVLVHASQAKGNPPKKTRRPPTDIPLEWHRSWGEWHLETPGGLLSVWPVNDNTWYVMLGGEFQYTSMDRVLDAWLTKLLSERYPVWWLGMLRSAGKLNPRRGRCTVITGHDGSVVRTWLPLQEVTMGAPRGRGHVWELKWPSGDVAARIYSEMDVRPSTKGRKARTTYTGWVVVLYPMTTISSASQRRDSLADAVKWLEQKVQGRGDPAWVLAHMQAAGVLTNPRRSRGGYLSRPAPGAAKRVIEQAGYVVLSKSRRGTARKGPVLVFDTNVGELAVGRVSGDRLEVIRLVR